MAASLWRSVLDAKEYLFRHDVLWCSTVCVPVHRFLRKYDSYRYYSALLLGPDDQLWEDLGIPFVKSTWRDGSIDFTKPQHASDMERKDMHGAVFGTYEGRVPVIVLCNVDMINTMLGKFEYFGHRRVYLCGHEMFDNMLPMIEGKKWYRIKKVIKKPLAYKAGVDTRTDLMKTCADVVVRQIAEIADGNGIVEDGRRTFGVYSMDVITRAIYGKPIGDYENPDNMFIRNSMKLLLEGRDDVLLNAVRYPEFQRRPKDCPFHPDAIEYFRQYVEEAVSERMDEDMDEFDDLLQLLLDAHLKNTISMNELYAQVIILTALSYHSISFTVAVACFEISQNPAIQDRLKKEIDTCINDYDGLNDASLKEMKYLDCVIKEAMRKYPAAARIERVCKKPITINDLPIAKGTVIAVPIYALHHDRKIYPNPDLYDPERFERDDIPVFAFLPFGERNRMCIAHVFAMREMKVLMATLLRKITLLPPLDARPLVLTSKKNVLLAEKIQFRVERREK